MSGSKWCLCVLVSAGLAGFAGCASGGNGRPDAGPGGAGGVEDAGPMADAPGTAAPGTDAPEIDSGPMACSTAALPSLALEDVARFRSPVFVTSAPGDDDTLYVVEKGGAIRVVEGGTTVRDQNFLDIGGGASPERVAKSFKAVLKDKKVKALLLNVFAGINRCDWVAKGVVDAVSELNIKMPVVVRLAGTNVEEGRRILNESGLTVITAETLAEAAEKAVAAAKSAA